MKKKFAIFALLFLSANWAFSQDKDSAFTPISYVGRWEFKNTQSGTVYTGEMKIVLTEKAPEAEQGVQSFKGKYSFDGRQTNDKCSTFGVFGTDKPIDLLWDQKGEDVVLTYELPCNFRASKISTSKFKLQGNDLVKDYSASWGKGIHKLTKQ